MPQESGSVNAVREAIIAIRLVGGDPQQCVIDTGFDGALILPTSVVTSLGLPVIARLVFELVGGARMSADVALGEVEWLGERRSVEVIISEGNDALVGTEMLELAKLIVDYPNRSVTISQAAPAGQSEKPS
jgi:clan AA aspartic protease